MLANSYVGIVQPEVPRLIAKRARRFHVSRDDIDDLQQQIVPLLTRFRFDPSRANGATCATALTGVIDRQIKAYLRSKHRYQRRVERLQTLSGNRVGESTISSEQATPPEPTDLRIDLERTMSSFSPRDREICQGLGHGLTVKAIAAQLGCGRDTVTRAVARIRRRFEAAGLRAWIDPDYRSDKHAEQGRSQQ
jgi:RNA polymerase sigma factor (sigma-70 family)